MCISEKSFLLFYVNTYQYNYINWTIDKHIRIVYKWLEYKISLHCTCDKDFKKTKLIIHVKNVLSFDSIF